VTPRGTDWSLALLVALLFATGLFTWYSGERTQAWVFAAHGVLGGSLALLLIWKLRRVGRRVVEPAGWDRRAGFGLASLLLVGLVLVSGWLWSTAGAIYLSGYSLLVWHAALGGLLTVIVVVHLGARAKLPRPRDVAGRRQLLSAAGIAIGGFVAWRVQRPLAAALGLPGADRRFTGSYEAGSHTGNDFPTTSWVADSPRPLSRQSYRLRVEGAVDHPLALTAAELDAGDELEATLDCTGGFYTTQRWRGVRLGRLLDRAGPRAEARYARIVSHTGYRWSFDLVEARDLLLATAVGGEPLSHDHGAPARLVAPGRRGFQWVKWVVRVDLHEQPDYGSFASTLWSSFTPEGRGS
jgi:molybdopterin-dependent oxidoreductase-like protein protein